MDRNIGMLTMSGVIAMEKRNDVTHTINYLGARKKVGKYMTKELTIEIVALFFEKGVFL